MNERKIRFSVFSKTCLPRIVVTFAIAVCVAATARVPAARAATPTATRKATPTPTPTALALWMENAHSENVHEFKGTVLTRSGVSVPNPNLTNQSPDFRSPLGGDTAGISFDPANNQWVTNCTGNTGNKGNITEFKLSTLKTLGSNSAPNANVVITDNGSGKLVNCPWGVTFRSGNLWAANSDQNINPPAPGFVTEYLASQLTASGHPTPHITLTDPVEFISPTGVIFDGSGNLFVVDFGPEQFGRFAAGKIWVFNAATINSLAVGTNSKRSTAHLSDPGTLTPVNGAFDRGGNLWIPDCEANGTGELYMFPKAALTTGATRAQTIFEATPITTPNGTENSIECPGGIAFDAAGNLWYTNFESMNNLISGAVGEFTRSQLLVGGTSKPKPNIFLDGNSASTNFDGPIGLAFGPVL